MNKILWQQYGLSEINGKRIIDVLSRFSEVQEAVLFGSRAKGNYNQGSDIDIAVKGIISKMCCRHCLLLSMKRFCPILWI